MILKITMPKQTWTLPHAIIRLIYFTINGKRYGTLMLKNIQSFYVYKLYPIPAFNFHHNQTKF